jgi:hypothetical protein
MSWLNVECAELDDDDDAEVGGGSAECCRSRLGGWHPLLGKGGGWRNLGLRGTLLIGFRPPALKYRILTNGAVSSELEGLYYPGIHF